MSTGRNRVEVVQDSKTDIAILFHDPRTSGQLST